MTTRFLILAAIMVVVALACVLVPMLRAARREGHPRAPFLLALLLALATPPVVLAGYLAVGTPQALEAAVPANRADLATATGELQASLAKKPGDAHGWALLAQARMALGQPREAVAALDQLLKLQPDDPDAMVAWVEARADLDANHAIDDTSRARLQHVLQLDPTHQRALWLLGISDFQRGQYADAARRWKTLLPLLQPGSKVAQTVAQQLAEAEARAAGGAQPAAGASTATTGTGAPDGIANPAPAGVRVTVKLDPKLSHGIRPDDTVYVYARAVGGPAMPLAVARLSASALPTSVTLTDAMAMTPALALSKFPHVEVVARLSRSGNATPQPGDLESGVVRSSPASRSPVTLTIDHSLR